MLAGLDWRAPFRGPRSEASGSLPVDHYSDFSAVVLVKPMELDSYNSWNSPENQELLRKFVEQGGTLVILDRGYPIMRDDPAGFSNFSDLFGFSTFDSVVTAPPLVRATEEGAEIFSDPA